MSSRPNATVTFKHRFIPRQGQGLPVTLLLLHGTGGTEDDLLPLGQKLAPGTPILSPRGRVTENGMARFFRRISPGVFDEEDLFTRTHELAEFLGAAAGTYHFDARRVVAVGYSNGANMAASLLLLDPHLLAGAVLFRAMIPFAPKQLHDLTGRPILLSSGQYDPMVAPGNTTRLVSVLEDAGADVTLRWQPAGHELHEAEIEEARRWLQENFGVRKHPPKNT